MQITPPIRTRGVYELKTPWQVVAGAIYTCDAIRSFEDCAIRGIDVLKDVYEKNGLGTTEYERDRQANINIVTLISDTAPIIYVPDSYILSYPNMGSGNYQHIVLSVSLGLIANNQDLSYLEQQMSNLASDVVGGSPVVTIHRAPSTGVISDEQAAQLEANRKAAIKNRDTDYGLLVKARNDIDDLSKRYSSLENAVKKGFG